MYNKRFFPLLLAFVLLFSLISLVSCQKDGEENTVDAPTASAPDTDAFGEVFTVDTDPEPLFPETSLPQEEVPEVPDSPIDPTLSSGKVKEASDWCQSAFDAALKGTTATAPAFLDEAWPEIYSVVTGQMQSYFDYYARGGMSDAAFSCLMTSYASLPSAKGLAEGTLLAAEEYLQERDFLSHAKNAAEKGNFMQAALYLAKENKLKTEASNLIRAHFAGFKEGITEATTQFMVRYEIAEGKQFLTALQGLGVEEHLKTEAARLEEYRSFQEDNLVSCNVLNTMENIYTHCLIAFPEINFASEKTYRWCGDDCLTVSEFNAILNSLYEKGYIIVDANEFYNAETDSPRTVLKLPKGKKPLLLTFDDVTYDSRKKDRGMVDRLMLDENGAVCTYTKHADGTEVISYENEIFPIIDAFVRLHPDFTFHGARGTLFFTGFDGILGYRTQSEPVDAREAALGLDRQKQIRQAKQVIEAMRKEGWTFGSHSYNHGRMPTYSPERFRKDTDMWLEEVGAIVGETDLFCWPYGGHTAGSVNLRKNDEHKYLFEKGFTFFFGCGSKRYLANEPDDCGIFSDRKAITGEILYYYQMGYKTYLSEYSYLFDPNSIWDPAREPYRYLPPYDASKVVE